MADVPSESSTVAAATVSVVIPTRDRSGLIEATLDSVSRQSRPVDQIVVVDDGSAPEHARRLRDLASTRPDLELVRREASQGPSAARNLGLSRVTGSHVFFLDDDDLIHPRFCETALETFESRADADVVVLLYECFFGPEGLAEHPPVATLFDCRTLSAHPLQRIGVGNPPPLALLESSPVSSFLRFLIPIHACVVKRTAIGSLRFPESLAQGEDTYFWISLATRGARFVGCPEVLAYVRRHGGNMTRSRARYAREIQPFYEAVLAEGHCADRSDAFLAHLKLFWFGLTTGGRWGRHLRAVLGTPRLLAQEIGFWTANLRRRRRLLRYYFGP